MLMEEILHPLTSSLSHALQRFVDPRWYVMYIHRLQVAHTESFHLTACLRFVEIQQALGPGFAWLKMPGKSEPTNKYSPIYSWGFSG